MKDIYKVNYRRKRITLNAILLIILDEKKNKILLTPLLTRGRKEPWTSLNRFNREATSVYSWMESREPSVPKEEKLWLTQTQKGKMFPVLPALRMYTIPNCGKSFQTYPNESKENQDNSHRSEEKIIQSTEGKEETGMKSSPTPVLKGFSNTCS